MQPELKAEFVLDPGGKPKFVERNGKRHYDIRLRVDSAPDDAYGVTYELDPSYYDAVREAKDVPGGRFEENINSYGDYVIRAAVRAKSGPTILKDSLAVALKRSYLEPAIASNDIQKALQDIETQTK